MSDRDHAPDGADPTDRPSEPAPAIRVVTDSSSDLPDALVRRHAIEVVPLKIRFGDEEFVDREELTNAEFWMKLTDARTLPETSAPSAGDFFDRFSRLADEGAEGIVAVCLSSRLSATYQSAVIAAEKIADRVPVQVVDSRAVSMALGFQALEAARAAEAGRSLPGVTQAALDAVPKTNVLATLDTLEFLRRGGRIGNAQAFFGNLLNVKPLITFEDGAVASAGRVRTRGRALAAIADRVAALAPEIVELAVLHGAAPDVHRLVELIRPHLSVDPIMAELGPVVGTHSGPGVVGVAWRLR